MDVFKVLANYGDVAHKFPDNSFRKNYFLAVCHTLDSSRDLETIDKLCPYGGIIGIGDSVMAENLLNWSKVFRMHAIFHDGCGFMKSQFNVGPGYCYQLPQPIRINSCFLGHITGLAYCLYIKLFRSVVYYSFDC